MKILIKVTKEVLQEAMMCGVDKCNKASGCAIAVAVRGILPYASVTYKGGDREKPIISFMGKYIRLPIEASHFMQQFDSLDEEPSKRLLMDEASFEVDIPDEVVENIGIEEAHKILRESKTLELVK